MEKESKKGKGRPKQGKETKEKERGAIKRKKERFIKKEKEKYSCHKKSINKRY